MNLQTNLESWNCCSIKKRDTFLKTILEKNKNFQTAVKSSSQYGKHFSLCILYEGIVHLCTVQKFPKYFQLFLRKTTKNSWKGLTLILKNNAFLEQIFKKLFSIKNLSNTFFELDNHFYFKEQKVVFKNSFQTGH